MTLDEYLRSQEINMKNMAKQLDVAYVYLSEIRRKIRRPSLELANKIELMTGGQVTTEELRGRHEKK